MKAKTILLPFAALLPGAALVGTAEFLLRAATDREPPRSMRLLKKIQGLNKGEDPYAFLAPDVERLHHEPHERVEIAAPDGTVLVGHWFEVPAARRALIAVHGWRSQWYRDFAGSFDFYRKQGCSVLYIEQRGQGESGGDYIGFGLTERFDLPLWAEWIEKRCGKELPVYPAGISMGASTVLMAADLDFPGNVRGFMADCPFNSAEGIWRYVAEENLHIPYDPVRPALRLRFRQRFGMAPDAQTCPRALARCKKPVLLIHGGADRFVPPWMSREAYAACAGEKRLLIVPGAIHGLSYLVDKPGYERAVIDFWKICEK